jgi:hypothetical protein
MFWNKKEDKIPQSDIEAANVINERMLKERLVDVLGAPEIQAKVKQFEEFAAYLKAKGLEITPSGAKTQGIIGSTAESIGNVGRDTFHIGRGLVRKVTNPIGNKINELKELGT